MWRHTHRSWNLPPEWRGDVRRRVVERHASRLRRDVILQWPKVWGILQRERLLGQPRQTASHDEAFSEDDERKSSNGDRWQHCGETSGTEGARAPGNLVCSVCLEKCLFFIWYLKLFNLFLNFSILLKSRWLWRNSTFYQNLARRYSEQFESKRFKLFLFNLFWPNV